MSSDRCVCVYVSWWVPSRPVSDDMLPDRDDLWPTTRPFLLASFPSTPCRCQIGAPPLSFIPSPWKKKCFERRRKRKNDINISKRTIDRRSKALVHGGHGSAQKNDARFCLLLFLSCVFGSGMLVEIYHAYQKILNRKLPVRERRRKPLFFSSSSFFFFSSSPWFDSKSR